MFWCWCLTCAGGHQHCWEKIGVASTYWHNPPPVLLAALHLSTACVSACTATSHPSQLPAALEHCTNTSRLDVAVARIRPFTDWWACIPTQRQVTFLMSGCPEGLPNSLGHHLCGLTPCCHLDSTISCGPGNSPLKFLGWTVVYTVIHSLTILAIVWGALLLSSLYRLHMESRQNRWEALWLCFAPFLLLSCFFSVCVKRKSRSPSSNTRIIDFRKRSEPWALPQCKILLL